MVKTDYRTFAKTANPGGAGWSQDQDDVTIGSGGVDSGGVVWTTVTPSYCLEARLPLSQVKLLAKCSLRHRL